MAKVSMEIGSSQIEFSEIRKKLTDVFKNIKVSEIESPYPNHYFLIVESRVLNENTIRNKINEIITNKISSKKDTFFSREYRINYIVKQLSLLSDPEVNALMQIIFSMDVKRLRESRSKVD